MIRKIGDAEASTGGLDGFLNPVNIGTMDPPPRTFGMLFDCHEKEIEIFLYSPQKNVANMLWFRQFFQHVADGCFVLRDKPQEEFASVIHDHWKSQSPESSPL